MKRPSTMLAILLWLLPWFVPVPAQTAHAGTAAIQPAALRCEHQVDPLGVDAPWPRLSWMIQSAARSQRQTAYRLLVASDPGTLAADVGDLWDSGKVATNRTSLIAYAGQPLRTAQTVYWKVRLWDRDGEPSPWSQPAAWTMGVLRSEDWTARWIQAPPAASLSGFGAARWIWHAEPEWPAPAAATRTPPNVAANVTRCFQRAFEVPAGRPVRNVRLLVSLDNEGEVWLNGQPVATVRDWQQAVVCEPTAALRPGANLLAVRAFNGGSAPNPAGVIARLTITLDTGQELEVLTDSAWRTSAQAAGGEWRSQPMAEWPAAVALGAFGMEPWGTGIAMAPAQSLPIFRQEFRVSKPLRRALVFVCGLGHYELFLNGRKVGNRFLDPAWSVYEKTVYYTTYDFTAELRSGTNALGVLLGKGFFNTAGDRRVHGVRTNRPLQLILQARLEYADGSRQHVGSDPGWRATPGPITHCAILGGSDYDARRLPGGWAEPGFDDSDWAQAELAPGPGGALVAASAPPLRVFDVFQPVRTDQPAPGVFVYDFGQNASAVPRVRVRGQAGQVLRLTPSEQRHGQSDRTNDGHGRVNQAGVGQPNYWQYTLRGGAEETWMPPFTYSGFQYLELTGGVPAGVANPQGLPVVLGLESVHVRNAAAARGAFACSDPQLNAIDRLIDWAVRSNLGHVLTDCPHREKLGWLEVSYLMGPAIAFRYDVSQFYAKQTRDIRDSQGDDGAIYTVAPNYPDFQGGFRYTPEWGAAGVVLPWLLYQEYGDRRVLAENYPAMKRFVDFMHRTAKDLLAAPGLGDWYDYGHGHSMGPARFTPPELTATATFYLCTRLTAQAAGVLGNGADQAAYTELAGRIKRQFNDTWFDGTQEYQNHGSPQTANAMALVAGLVDPPHAGAVLDRIVADLRARKYQQTAGDIGFVYLIRALAGQGRSDVLFELVKRRDIGSYGFILDRGWTSMPEAWDASTGASMNHCMLGHIQEWFYRHLAGLQPDPEGLGYQRIILRPEPVGSLQWVQAHHDTVHGRIAVHWRREADRFRLEATVPANTTATVWLPARAAGDVTEAGAPVALAEGVRVLGFDDGRLRLSVGSGTFRFGSTLTAAAPK